MSLPSLRLVRLFALAGLVLSGAAQAALHDRGGGLVYDDVLNVTWLQDANFAKTSGYDTDGLMNWSMANDWAAELVFHDSVRNDDYDDWRLPTTAPVDGVSYNFNWSTNGTTDVGYNVGAPGTLYAGSVGSEMANLSFNSLGNKAYYNPATGKPQDGSGLANSGPFRNFPSDEYMIIGYWSGTAITSTSLSWVFFVDSGQQSIGDQYGNEFYAWAVRDGDVAAVPEPESYAMLLAGLGLVGWVARRRQAVRAS